MGEMARNSDAELMAYAQTANSDSEIRRLVALGLTRPEWGEPWTKELRDRILRKDSGSNE